jgi:hypothetical protein
MLSGLISGFTKGKIKEYSDAWLCSGCIVGGLANMVILNAFKYYPFLSFGAFYSMIWHFLMVMLGLLLITSKYVQMNYKTIIKGFIFHLCISLIVIPIDYIFNFDFMMYKDLGSIPIFESVATNLTNNNIGFLNPLLMLMLYFISFNLIYLVYFIISKFRRKHE